MRVYILSVLALATSAIAGTAFVRNNCGQTVYLTITRGNQATTTSTIAPGGSFSEGYHGTGNSIGVTKNPDYYSPNTPKLIFGYSDQPPTVYWSVNSVNGDPFSGQTFSVDANSGNGACPGTVGYNGGKVLGCGNGGSLTLKLC
ncbi:hypothetical protein K402DRAFT_425774 [Aulographum hederae CBS 113979]|uniref:Uncharacterized protein n=1 Tax=Aulographum hederae CBS 113979 TaxID=1176131 RepID=A0A6G1GJG0_9PEZI|nr:hypothetical protein K402DRAFT_425774 [Aulographum hederae CBS 113979]